MNIKISMLMFIKSKALSFAKANWLVHFLLFSLAQPIYRSLRWIWHVIRLFVKSLSVFGLRKTLFVFARHIWSIVTSSHINFRLKQEILRLGNADTIAPGSATKKGFLYHDIPFPDQLTFNSHRQNSLGRLAMINKHVRFSERRVLDIGCANGSISLGSAIMGATKVIGIDYDRQALRVAEALRDKYRLENVDFRHQILDHESSLCLPEVDLLVWLSNWMWLVKAYGLEKGLDMLYDIPYTCRAEKMVFESAADDGMAPIKGSSQKDIEKFLKDGTPFSVIRDIGPFLDKWRVKGKERHVFVCSERKTFFKAKQAVVERVKRNLIKKTFNSDELWSMENELKCLKRLDKYDFFPNIVDIGLNWYKMSYCGVSITQRNQLNDLLSIVEILEENNIFHRDINQNNLMYLNGQLSLIDFEWAVMDGEEPQQYIPEGLGRGYYDTNNFNDRNAVINLLKDFYQ